MYRVASTSTAPGPASRPVAAQQVDAPVGQPLLGTRVGVVRDHEVAPRERGRDVDLRARRRVVGGVGGLTGAQQRLGRDARPVGALATHQLAFDDGDAQTALGQRAGAVLAGRAGTEDDDVVVGHVGGSAPDCSATMYAAYHAGQFRSRSPVRCSCSPCAASARSSAPARSATELNVVADGVDPTGQAVGDLLQLPDVAVRIAELRERRVGVPLRVGATRPGRGVEAVVADAGVVEDVGVDTGDGERVVRRLDVGDDEERFATSRARPR